MKERFPVEKILLNLTAYMWVPNAWNIKIKIDTIVRRVMSNTLFGSRRKINALSSVMWHEHVCGIFIARRFIAERKNVLGVEICVKALFPWNFGCKTEKIAWKFHI